MLKKKFQLMFSRLKRENNAQYHFEDGKDLF